MPSSAAASRKEPSRAAASKAVRARKGGKSRRGRAIHQKTRRGLYNTLKRWVLRGCSRCHGKFLMNFPHHSVDKIEAFSPSAKRAHSAPFKVTHDLILRKELT